LAGRRDRATERQRDSGIAGNSSTGMRLTHHLRSYALTTGHKTIGWEYGYLGFIGGLYGFLLSMMMRLELGSPGLGCVRKVREAWMYNSWITLHGLSMLFLFVMPVAIGGFGNYLLPMLLGSSEMVMPRANGASVWLLAAGLVTAVLSSLVSGHPCCSGWTLYPPLSTRDADGASCSTDLALITVHALGLSSGLGAFNFVSTCQALRHRGLTSGGMELYVWSLWATAVLLIGALPVLGVAITGLLLDRNAGTCVFDGGLGGDPVLYQHLFWFFGHPEVYVIILPLFGMVSMSVAVAARRGVYGRAGMCYCMISIGVVGFCVWAHHMFTAGLDVDTRAYFSAATSVVAVPTAVKVFSYCATLTGGRWPHSGVGWSIWAFVICFGSGGLTGLMLSMACVDVMVHDTYFVVGHFHTVLSLGAVYGVITGTYLLHGVRGGKSVLEGSALYVVCGILMGGGLTFGPMHTLGLGGLARRVPEYADVYAGGMNVSTSGILLLLMAVVVYVRGLVRGLSCSAVGGSRMVELSTVVLPLMLPDGRALLRRDGSQRLATQSCGMVFGGRSALAVSGLCLDQSVCMCVGAAGGLAAATIRLWSSRVERAGVYSGSWTSHAGLELAWTLGPVAYIGVLAGEGLCGLYALEALGDAGTRWVRMTARQWQWDVRAPQVRGGGLGCPGVAVTGSADAGDVCASVDVRRVYGGSLRCGTSRLTVSDQPVFIASGSTIGLVVSSADVLHSLAVPGLGVKADCVPGRASLVTMSPTVEGVFNGYCAELCGSGHGFMPLNVVCYTPTLEAVASPGGVLTLDAPVVTNYDNAQPFWWYTK